MPYIAIRSFPKDEETKNKVAEEINKIFLEYWGCPPEAISISMEEVKPEGWQETVVKPEIEKKLDKMKYLSGKKQF